MKQMEQVANSISLERSMGFEGKRPLVFLDTDVIVGYLRGETSAAPLFSAEAEGRLRFAINPIVLQELLLAADAAGRPEFEFEIISEFYPSILQKLKRCFHEREL